MKKDIERWNSKFANRIINEQPQPDMLLLDTPWLPTSGRALDIASGSGQNAVHLALSGLHVTAIDGSSNGMDLALQLAAHCNTQITPIVQDLDCFDISGSFDLIIMFHYLNRTLYPQLPSLLTRNGILIVKTFNTDFAKSKPNFDPDFMLQENELSRIYSQLKILQYAESPNHCPGKSWIVAQNQ